MNLFRWMLGLPLAAIVTLGLFVAMSGLIAQPVRMNTPQPPPEYNILAKLKPSEPTKQQPPHKRIKDVPPPPDTRWKERVDPIDTGTWHEPEPLPVDGKIPTTIGGADPIIKLAPQYPEACKARGAQGVVLVQFDVTDRGEVTNVRVISSDHRCLDRAAIKAVMGWKYPPEARRGLVQKFVFSLNDG